MVTIAAILKTSFSLPLLNRRAIWVETHCSNRMASWLKIAKTRNPRWPPQPPSCIFLMSYLWNRLFWWVTMEKNYSRKFVKYQQRKNTLWISSRKRRTCDAAVGKEDPLACKQRKKTLLRTSREKRPSCTSAGKEDPVAHRQGKKTLLGVT